MYNNLINENNEGRIMLKTSQKNISISKFISINIKQIILYKPLRKTYANLYFVI